MGGNLICHHTGTHIVLVGQCKMLLWCYVAEHCSAIPAYHGSAYGTRDVVVGRCDVGYERTESVERCTMTLLYLAVHVGTNLLHWHMSRTLYKCLHVLLPSALHKFTHGVKLRKLCRVVGIVGRTGTKSVAERNSHVILGTDVADVVEMVVEETLLLVNHTPLRDDASAAAHHSRESSLRERHVLQSYAAVYGEIVNALLTLLYECVAEYLPCQVLRLSVHLLESLIHRHCAYWHRTVAQYPFACLVDVLSG